MTPELIALLLALPLPVRLALLDADPAKPGWWVRAKSYGLPPSVKLFDAPPPKPEVDDRDYWLPCNPLAIVRHAIALRGSGRPAVTFYDEIGWRFDIMEERRGNGVSAHKLSLALSSLEETP